MKNKKYLWMFLGVTLSMFLLAFAFVPLYSIFCKVTGYGGTTQVSELLPTKSGKINYIVKFDSDIAPNLNWEFKPLQKQISTKSGESALAYYYAENRSKETLKGTATYNVIPFEAASYFNKIECFCFREQELKPGEKIEMPVSFYIDPKIEDDKNLKNVKEITLHYTFFKTN